MQQISFYITEYWLQVLILVLVVIGLFLFLRSSSARNIQNNILVVAVVLTLVYLILFSGFLGSSIRTYFTDISNICFNSGCHFGTGSFVDHDLVITNHHVINNCSSDKIFVRNKSFTYRAKVIAILPKNSGDIAFLKTDGRSKNFIPLNLSLPKIEEIVFFPNYTSGIGVFDKSKGKITEINEREIMILAPKERKGISGSPLLNKNGEMIGIIWGVSGTILPSAAATRSSVILDFAKKNQIQLFGSQNHNKSLLERDFEDSLVNIVCRIN
jgi:hypothetical protein